MKKEAIAFPELKETFLCKQDARGKLCVAQEDQFGKSFHIKRVFWICDVPAGAVRGEHANRQCTELLVAVKGSVEIWLTDGKDSYTFLLNRCDAGIYIPPMVWCRLKNFSEDCVCLCMADADYDETHYINQYEQFLKETQDAAH